MAAKAQRHFVVVMAVIGFVATSACTRGGGSNPPIKQDSQPVTTPIPNAQSELDTQTSKSAQDSKEPQKPTPQAAPQAPSKAPALPQVTNTNNTSDTNAVQTTTPVSSQAASTDPQVIVYDPTGLTPDQIFERSNNQGPALVGNPSNVTDGQSGETLNYSGSGQDGLREQIQTFVDTQTRADRIQRDKNFAKTITDGRFNVDWSSRTATLDILVENKPYRFIGALDNKLRLLGGQLRRGLHLAIDASCMDLNGGCDTVYATIQDGTGGIVRTAHVLIRTTKATLYSRNAAFRVAHNNEFDALLHLLVNTAHRSGVPNSFNSLVLRTSETINGESSYKIEMGILSASGSQESLNFTGPLVKPATEIDLEAPARASLSSSPIAGTIRNVTLVNNDGRGTLTLAITVRKATADADEDTVHVTVARIHKPVRPLIIK